MFLSNLYFLKEKVKAFFRPTQSSTTTFSIPDVNTATTNNLSVPSVSSSALSSSSAHVSDIRAVKTMPELQSSKNSSSTSTSQRFDEQQQVFIKSVIDTILSIYEQSKLNGKGRERILEMIYSGRSQHSEPLDLIIFMSVFFSLYVNDLC